ncbi:MAG: hypothetical protein ACE5H4_00985 [Candidatus Thorarchaeota archaeon]
MKKGWRYYVCLMGGQLMWPRLALKHRKGLLSFNDAHSESPVLVTTDYYLTSFRVRETIEEQHLSCHLLVVDGHGINVWCGSRGGHVDTQSILDAIEQTGLANKITHRILILPQLIASSVSKSVLAANGWRAVFGPVKISDVGEFIDNDFEKTPEQSRVGFDFRARMENNLAHNVFETTMFLAMTPIFWLLSSFGGPLLSWFNYWWNNLLYIVIGAWVLGTFMAMTDPFMPTTSGYVRGLITGFLSLIIWKTSLLWLSTFSIAATTYEWAWLDPSGLMILGLALFVGFNWGGATPYLGEDQMIRDILAGLGTIVLLFALGFFFPMGII